MFYISGILGIHWKRVCCLKFPHLKVFWILGKRRRCQHFIDAMIFEQHVRQHLGVNRIAHDHRHNVAAMINDRQAKALEPRLEDAGGQLVCIAARLVGFQVRNRGRSARSRGEAHECGRTQSET